MQSRQGGRPAPLSVTRLRRHPFGATATDGLAVAVPIVGALALYGRTLAPGLTWAHTGADGGDLLAAALSGGVPHPTGYPTYTLLLRAATSLLPTNPARAGNWLSALCVAAAAALLADLARRTLAHLDRRRGRLNAAASALAGLAWAAAPSVWGQATITEVYGLHALAFVLLLWIVWRWGEDVGRGVSRRGWPAAAGLVMGLGLGNHLSLALALPGVAAWIWGRRQDLAPGPSHWRWALGGLLAGLCVYVYLPAAARGNPPVNWGNPGDVRGFLWTVSGRLYAPLAFGVPVAELPARAWTWLREAAEQFGGPWGALLALAGAWALQSRLTGWWRCTALTALLFSLYAAAYRSGDWFVYLLPAWACAALWLAWGAAWVIGEVRKRQNGAGVAKLAAPTLLLALLIVMPGLSLARHWQANDLSGDTQAMVFTEEVLATARPGSVVLSASDGPTFALWYAIYGLRERADLVPVNVNMYGYAWHRAPIEREMGRLPEDLVTFLDTAARTRTVYRVEPLDIALPGFEEIPEGKLIRLLSAAD